MLPSVLKGATVSDIDWRQVTDVSSETRKKTRTCGEVLRGLRTRLDAWRRDGSPPIRLTWGLWIAALVAGSWPWDSLKPYPKLDQGWQAGLSLARETGLKWGPDIAFSYGPLGFLAAPKGLSASIILLSAVYVASVMALFYAVIVWRLHSHYGAAVAVAGSFIVFSLFPGDVDQIPVLTALVVGISFLAGEIRTGVARWIPALFGAMAASQLLVKADAGLAIAALGLVLTAFAASRWRRLLEFGAAFIVVLIGSWFTLGQPLENLPHWVSRTLSEVTGFSSAMSTEVSTRDWERAAAGILLVAVFLLYFVALRRSPAAKSWGLLLFVGTSTWFFLKMGFVRHDEHSIRFFFFVIVLLLALPWRHSWRGPVAITLLLATPILLAVSGRPAESWLSVRSSPRGLIEGLHAAASNGERYRMLHDARLNYKRGIPIPQNLLRLVGDAPVHIDSVETTAAWAYGVNWRPVPVFQSYSAYTHSLDSANAERLLESDGPTRVLRRVEGAIDGRYRLQEAPEYTLALVCNFTRIGANDSWQVLDRIGNRCGRMRKLGDAPLQNGKAVAVPIPTAPNMLVVGRIDLDPSLVWRVRNLVFKSSIASLVLDGSRYRFVNGTAEGPLLLHLTPTLGWSPELGRSIDSRSIGLENYSGSARISFYEISVRPA
jgi:hypothetical protein